MAERPIGTAPHALADFEALALPHLEAAQRLARRLLRDEHDAQDAVQDAFVRALRHFHGYRGGDARAWLLAIVRNVCLTRHRRGARERLHSALEDAPPLPSPADDPETALLRAASDREVRAAIERLASDAREVLLLRELHDLSYREIADTLGIPAGTVMSRLARARDQLRRLLARSEEAP